MSNFFFSQILFPLKKAAKTTLHLNISSIGSHIDGLRTFLIFLGVKFDIIWISESWITKNLPPVKNINFPGFTIEKTSTKSTAGGTIMSISQNISSKTLTDLNIYSAKEMESFVKILKPHKPSYVVGTTYKYPQMKLPKFNILFSELLLKLKNQKLVLPGNFHLNFLNNANKPETHKFLEQIFSINFIPQITLPTRVPENSSTLIDNKLLKNHKCTPISRNITSFSDHLPIFLSMSSRFYIDLPKLKRNFKIVWCYSYWNKLL